MKVSILMGSPRKDGNTNAILTPFMDEWKKNGNEADLFWLYDMDITGCTACRTCQKDWSIFGCAWNDDGQEIFEEILGSDLIVLATPIYSFYCTPPMKAACG